MIDTVKCPLYGRHNAKAFVEPRPKRRGLFDVEIRCAKCKSRLAALPEAANEAEAIKVALAAYLRLPDDTRRGMVGQRVRRFFSPLLADDWRKKA